MDRTRVRFTWNGGPRVIPLPSRRPIVTAFDIASRFVGVREVPGSQHNPQIIAMLRLDASTVAADEVPWCSAFANYVAWLLRLPRSKSLLARSWLAVGQPVTEPQVGFDVVVLMRGPAPQPDASNTTAPGHVGFFAGFEGDKVAVLGGNQGDRVSVALFPRELVLGYRRL